jgi:hypothetical protein
MRLRRLRQWLTRAKSGSTADKDKFPVRSVVPPRLKGASAGVPPTFTYNGGPLLTSVVIDPIFWGPLWNGNPGGAHSNDILDFLNILQQSDYLDQLSHAYSVAGMTLPTKITQLLPPKHWPDPPTDYAAPGSLPDPSYPPDDTVPTTPATRLYVDYVNVGNLLEGEWIPNNIVSQPTPATLYMIFTDPNIGSFIIEGSRLSPSVSYTCNSVYPYTCCGYHWRTPSGILYAVVPWCDDQCLGDTISTDNLRTPTVAISHELVETITDPQIGTGWYSSSGEVADYCGYYGNTVTITGPTVPIILSQYVVNGTVAPAAVHY